MSTTITVSSGTTSTGNVISGGYLLDVLSGGSLVSATILSGGNATIVGSDSGTTIEAGGNETVSGTATGDVIFGTQLVSAATVVVTNETVGSGGNLDLYLKGAVANGTTAQTGGAININGAAFANNTVIDGGTIVLESAKAIFEGTLDFIGSGTIEETAVVSSGYGDTAVISGFGAGDAILITSMTSSATLASSIVSGNTVETITSGGTSESFTFSGTGYAPSYFVLSQTASGAELTVSSATATTLTVSSGQSAPASYVVSGGYTLDVLAGGSATGVTVLSGGNAIIAGTDSGSTINAGGTETVSGTVTGDQIYGLQTESAATALVSDETIYNGGVLDMLATSGSASSITVETGGTVDLNANAPAFNLVIQGGSVVLESHKSNIDGTLSFSGAGTLAETTVISAGYGDLATIEGFGAGDVIDLSAIGSGASLTSAISGGDTVITISGGSTEDGESESFTFSGTGGSFALGADITGTGAALTLGGSTSFSGVPTLTSFTAGDIVISVVGDGNDSGDYTDNQAAPIVLEEIDPTTGAIVGEMVLPQAATTVDGTIENPISGEYGSSSEGILQLANNGQSLVIAGYGINAATFNAGGAAVYGNAALAQSTSVQGGPYTAVSRVIADISFNGSVDTSTALYNVFNTNNPRSVTTVNGTSFYISGQGVKGDTTEGVFFAEDGASSATSIDDATDTRTVEIYNGALYVSQNSSQGTANIETFGGLPTSTATPSILSGIDQSVILTAAQENTLNAGAVGTSVALSPEQYFFANATTLYVADGGQPKAGTIGDGGLQKWTLNPTTGVWTLDYTLSAGLNLIQNSSVSADTAGTTGLIGLSGVLNADGTVTFYTTNSTIGDLDQTYLYTITDNVAATTAPTGESFTVVETAAADTNIRGIALAPSAPVSTVISAGVTSTGLTVSNGSTLTVQAGGTASGAVILSGGIAFISGSDSASLLVEGGSETVYGSATGDEVYGTQIVSGGVSGETVYYDGLLDVMSGGTASNITVAVDGELAVSGTASDTVVDGGTVVLATTGAALTGEIFGFSIGDIIDLTQIGTGAVLTSAVVGGNTVETISGRASESFTLAGKYAPGIFGLVSDGGTGVDFEIVPTVDTGASTISSGETSEDVTIANGASVTVASGGTLIGATILSGGTVTVSGSATGDAVYGLLQLGEGGSATNETVYSGGVLLIDTDPAVDNVTISGGTVVLGSSDASVGGTISFEGAGTLEVTTSFNAGDGVLATISGFGAGDVIEITDIANGATLTSTASGSNTVETVTSGGISDSFTFGGTSYGAGYFVLSQTNAGEELVVSASNTLTIGSGQVAPPNCVVSGGYTLDVLSAGSATGVTVLPGGNINVSSGGIETGGTILAGGTETLFGGTVTGDLVFGLQQIVSANATTGVLITRETIENGGSVDIFYKDNTISNSTILTGGALNINGNATGTNLVIDGGVIDLQSPKANLGGMLSFSGAGTLEETAVISAGYGDLATIDGFSAGDVIDLSAIGSGAMLTSTTSGGDTILTVSGGSAEGASSESLIFAGTGLLFSLSPDTSSGEEITEVPCFCAGTRIATSKGEVAVEDLRIGDIVKTLHADDQRIKWIGTRSYVAPFAGRNQLVLPIHIKAGAIADAVPARDLFVSPGHAICIDDALIHAFRLINGVSIIQLPDVESVTYFHIELENHEVLFAENCPAETFMGEEFRGQFHNANEFAEIYPGEAITPAMCLPRLDSGFQLRAIQNLIAARAGIAKVSANGALRGYVDQVGPEVCSGWAQCIGQPNVPVCLDIMSGSRRIGRVLANLYREDVHAADYGSGYHGFEFALPPQEVTKPITVRHAKDGEILSMAEQAVACAA